MPGQRHPSMIKLKRSIRMAEVIGLVAIAIATVIAGGSELYNMFLAQKVTLGDLLLLFLYLEVLAMVAIYLDSGKLPVRFPMYIAIIALARYLILDMKNMDHWVMISVGVTMLLIAFAVLVIRYGHLKLPYPDHQNLEENLLKDDKKV